MCINEIFFNKLFKEKNKAIMDDKYYKYICMQDLFDINAMKDLGKQIRFTLWRMNKTNFIFNRIIINYKYY